MHNSKEIYDEITNVTDGCYHYLIGEDKYDYFALVFAYDDEEILHGKVAYQSKNSMLQCDYDFDWIMPYNEQTADVYDTDIEITCKEDIDWLYEQWLIMKKENGYESLL